LVKYLIEHGADANLLDADGKKPLDVVGMVRGAAVANGPATPVATKGKGGAKGGPGGGPSAANLAEVRSLLEAASAKKQP